MDDTGWLKCGSASPGVARQYTATAGKVTNRQIGVSVNLVTDTASCPANWRLFLPAAWDPDSPDAGPDVARRRDRAGIPYGVGHREKWHLALDMIDELTGCGLWAPLVVADAGHGDVAEFRHGLTERDVSHVVRASIRAGGYPQCTVRTAPPYQDVGTYPQPRYREPAVSVNELILAGGPEQAQSVAWLGLRSHDHLVVEANHRSSRLYAIAHEIVMHVEVHILGRVGAGVGPALELLAITG